MISQSPKELDIDEQDMNEAIRNPRANGHRRSHPEGSRADSEYAHIVAELRQLRAASQLSRYVAQRPACHRERRSTGLSKT
jgi:hypothetical protein